MAAKEGAIIFESEIALNGREDEVAEHGDDRKGKGEDDDAPPTRLTAEDSDAREHRVSTCIANQGKSQGETTAKDDATKEAFPSLVWGDTWRHFVFAEEDADEIRGHVIAKSADDNKDDNDRGLPEAEYRGAGIG